MRYISLNQGKLVKNICVDTMQAILKQTFSIIMESLFSSLDTLLDLPFSAFEKRLSKLEEEFKNIAITDIAEEELEAYFLRLRDEYHTASGDSARTRLSVIGYLSHFDTLVEKYFPDYVALFQESLDR